MSSVLIVCGAGASSTFLAQALRRQAAVRGIEHTFIPASVSALTTPLSSVDVVLVSAHVADFFDQAKTAADRIGAIAVQLPAVAFTPVGADIALDLLNSLPQVTTESENHG
ncbi:MAG: PTS sugar transporter subunit IIB [Rhodoglobus sp.]